MTPTPGTDDSPTEKTRGDSCHRQTHLALASAELHRKLPAATVGKPRNTIGSPCHQLCHCLLNSQSVLKVPSVLTRILRLPLPYHHQSPHWGQRMWDNYSEFKRQGGVSNLRDCSETEAVSVQPRGAQHGAPEPRGDWLLEYRRKLYPVFRFQSHRGFCYRIVKTAFPASTAISQTR